MKYMDIREAGRRGGNATKKRKGKKFYSEIGKKGRKVQLLKAKELKA